MSYYYNYYIGYKKDNKIYPFGPYDANGKFYSIISKSRSFASNLYEDFYRVKEEQISDELRKIFSYKNYKNEEVVEVKYLPVKDLPKGSFIKTGYFLIDEVERYEKTEETDEFSTPLTPQIYAAKLQNEVMLGKKKSNDEECVEYNASDYMYYAYPDYNSKEYEAFILRNVAGNFDFSIPEGAELVILEDEG